jgi:Zn-dependent protease with chaperone function
MTRRILSVLAAAVLWASSSSQAVAAKVEKLAGYAEWREGRDLVVDGQRVRLAPGGRFKGDGEASGGSASIPLGYEVKAEGTRAADGVLIAQSLEAKPNGSAMFEQEIRRATDEAESEYRRAGAFYQEGGGRHRNVGRLYEDGPDVERVRAIVDELVPPYLGSEDLRVYVIDNPEWNAFAMGNYSIYAFSGLLDELDDDELAIVLGHELAHATHEHTRRQFKKQMWIQIAAAGVLAASNEIDDKKWRVFAQLLTVFGASAWANGYGRDLEDQADRVGLRYAYEAGFDITKGPGLWNRFARRYGEQGKVGNFLFGDHSLSRARARFLERELTLNYAAGPKAEGPSRAFASRARPGSRPHAATDATSAAGAGNALTSGSSAPSSGGGRNEIRLGMTPEQVRGLLGAPEEEVAFGERRKWSYPDLTVVFENGQVAEVKF